MIYKVNFELTLTCFSLKKTSWLLGLDFSHKYCWAPATYLCAHSLRLCNKNSIVKFRLYVQTNIVISFATHTKKTRVAHFDTY